MGFVSPREGEMPCLQLGAAACTEVCWLFIYQARGPLFYAKVSSLRATCGFCSPWIPAPLWNVHSPLPGWTSPNSRWLLAFFALKNAQPLFSESLSCFFSRL